MSILEFSSNPFSQFKNKIRNTATKTFRPEKWRRAKQLESDQEEAQRKLENDRKIADLYINYLQELLDLFEFTTPKSKISVSFSEDEFKLQKHTLFNNLRLQQFAQKMGILPKPASEDILLTKLENKIREITKDNRRVLDILKECSTEPIPVQDFIVRLSGFCFHNIPEGYKNLKIYRPGKLNVKTQPMTKTPVSVNIKQPKLPILAKIKQELKEHKHTHNQQLQAQLDHEEAESIAALNHVNRMGKIVIAGICLALYTSVQGYVAKSSYENAEADNHTPAIERVEENPERKFAH